MGKAIFAAQSIITLAIGLALFTFPDWVSGWWPWMLTPLTARAMASWLLGLAVVLATTLKENDWMRIRVAILTFVLLAALQLLALVRYTDDVQGGAAAVTIYIVFWATALALGLYGSLKAFRVSGSESPAPARPVATAR